MTQQPRPPAYDHQRLERRRRALRWLLANVGWPLFAKIDRIEHADRVPAQGSAILMINHIAFIDPIAVLGHVPRNVVPIAKAESNRVPFWGAFSTLWGVITVRRDGTDYDAVAQALEVLSAGEIILVAPEAVRSPALRRARDGVAYMAYRSGAPIIPVAVEGSEGFPSLSLRRRRQPGTVVRFGRPMRLRPFASRPSRGELTNITDEAMRRLAAMLPAHRRGVYADALDRPLRYFDQDEADHAD